MEIKVFMSFDALNVGKPVFCQRVSCFGPDFDFSGCIKLFQQIYGVGTIVTFICVGYEEQK